jgi:hypothetical protein
MKKDKCQRGTRIVEGKVQGELLRRVCLHWSLFFLLSLSLTVGLNILTSDPNVPLMNQVVNVLALNFWPFLVLVALLPYFLVDTVRLSSSFAGPIVRLRRSLESLAQRGDTTPLAFREGDFWVSAADAYNAVVDRQMRLQDRIEELEAQLAAAPTWAAAPAAGAESMEVQHELKL